MEGPCSQLLLLLTLGSRCLIRTLHGEIEHLHHAAGGLRGVVDAVAHDWSSGQYCFLRDRAISDCLHADIGTAFVDVTDVDIGSSDVNAGVELVDVAITDVGLNDFYATDVALWGRRNAGIALVGNANIGIASHVGFQCLATHYQHLDIMFNCEHVCL